MDIPTFKALLDEQGKLLYRGMPWRNDTRPYYVLVSEIMLQQTQVSRVIPKFNEFITKFPDIESLAQAPLSQVLVAWSGLGYNRRAKYLHLAAQKIIGHFAGVFPTDKRSLMSLPGIGDATAGAIMAYSFNQPIVFIETNVRTVYLYHFFHDQTAIRDTQIHELIASTLDYQNPRCFYWALMDYGTILKTAKKGSITASHHYKKQTPLSGSVREMRGTILRALADGPLSTVELRTAVNADSRFERAYADLEGEALIFKAGAKVSLGSVPDSFD